MRGPRQGVVLAALCAVAACKKAPPQKASVGDAPKHGKARQLALVDGKVLLDKGGRYERICKSSGYRGKGQSGCIDHHFYVFPLVPKGWKAGDEVPAFVTCSGRAIKSLAACRKEAAKVGDAVTGRVAVRQGDEDKAMRTRSGWEKAMGDAAKAHKLRIAKRAPVVRLPKAAP